MRSNKKIRQLIPAAFGLIVLILDSRTAIEGAQAGLETCLKTVLPSLFPFLFLSSLLTSSLLSANLKHSRFICRLYRIPSGSEVILLTGLLGGYPVGAKCIAEAVANGQLSHDDGKRMLIFCNAAGPAFLFGITGSIFPQRWVPWCLWALHIFSGFCIARLLPSSPGSFISSQPKPNIRITQRLRQSVQLMSEISGWIILMRIVIAFADKWLFGYLPTPFQLLATGLLELSNGCIALSKITNTGFRFILCSVFLGFGGLCVALQTGSAANIISQRMYLPGKLIQALISFLSAYIVQYIFWGAEEKVKLPWLFLSLLIIFTCIFIYYRFLIKKSCGILEHVGV